MGKLFAWRENNKARKDGPPDLDEAFKNAQKWLNNLLSGKKTNKNFSGFNQNDDNNRSDKQGGAFFGLAVIVGIILIAFMGFYKVEPGEQAAVYRLGKFIGIDEQGPHWIFPGIYTKEIVNVDLVNQKSFEDNLITKELNIVTVKLVVQYKIKNLEDYLFNVRSPEDSLSEATKAAIRHVIADSTLQDVLSTKGNVSTTFLGEQIKALMVKNIDYYKTGLEVQGVEIEAVLPPAQVKEAFNDAIQAQEDKERYKNEAEAYERKVVPVAEGNAERIIQDAKAYSARVIYAAEGDVSRFTAILPEYNRAPKVTRDRIYIQALEDTFKNTPKIMVDTKSNNVLFLPLDKLSNSLSNAISSNNSSNNQDDFNQNKEDSAENKNLVMLRESSTRNYDNLNNINNNSSNSRDKFGRSWRE